MSLIKCPKCKETISSEAYLCPHCGFKIQRNENSSNEQSQSVNLNTENETPYSPPNSNKEWDIFDVVVYVIKVAFIAICKLLAFIYKWVMNRPLLRNILFVVIGALVIGYIVFIWLIKPQVPDSIDSVNFVTDTTTTRPIVEEQDNSRGLFNIENTMNPDNDNVDDYEIEYDEDANIRECREVLMSWDNALKKHNLGALSGLYTSVVNYYMTNCTKGQIYETQHRLIEKNPGFYQYIDNVKPEVKNDFYIVLHFDKHVRTSDGGAYNIYPSYLWLIRQSDGWLICNESDEITDQNLKRKWNKLPRVTVTNEMPLDEIFNEKNVGKFIDVTLGDLVPDMENGTFGPLATVMDGSVYGGYTTTRAFGLLFRNFRGVAGTYYCNGSNTMGGYTTYCIWMYNTRSGELKAIWE
jgi:hypothetical protein